MKKVKMFFLDPIKSLSSLRHKLIAQRVAQHTDVQSQVDTLNNSGALAIWFTYLHIFCMFLSCHIRLPLSFLFNKLCTSQFTYSQVSNKPIVKHFLSSSIQSWSCAQLGSKRYSNPGHRKDGKHWRIHWAMAVPHYLKIFSVEWLWSNLTINICL